jgi:hypothetical protein
MDKKTSIYVYETCQNAGLYINKKTKHGWRNLTNNIVTIVPDITRKGGNTDMGVYQKGIQIF